MESELIKLALGKIDISPFEVNTLIFNDAYFKQQFTEKLLSHLVEEDLIDLSLVANGSISDLIKQG